MERLEVLEGSVLSLGIFSVRYAVFDHVFEFSDINFTLHDDHRGVLVAREYYEVRIRREFLENFIGMVRSTMYVLVEEICLGAKEMFEVYISFYLLANIMSTIFVK